MLFHVRKSRRPVQLGLQLELGEDDYLGPIILPNDSHLLRRLSQGETVQIYAIFFESYSPHSRWVGISVNDGDGDEDWRKVCPPH